MSFLYQEAPKYYEYSKTNMSTFLNTLQSKLSVTGYSVVERDGMFNWKGSVYPITFLFDDNTDKDKIITSAIIKKSLVEQGNQDVTVTNLNVLKKNYFLLVVKGEDTVTNGGKSRRRRQNKRKGKKRTRRSRK